MNRNKPFSRGRISLSFLFFIVLFMFSACFSPWQGTEDGGTVTFNFGGNSPARWTNGPLNPAIQAQLTHVIELWKGNSYDVLYKSITLDPGVTTHRETGIPPGSLKVKVCTTLNDYPFADGETTLTVVNGHNTATINMNRLDYGIILSEKNGGAYVFPALPAGYIAGSLTPLTVTVDNYAENATGMLAVSSSAPSSFSVSPATIASIGKDGSDAFTVVPGAGLPPGIHSGTITVSGTAGGGFSASFDVSFTTGLYGGSGTPGDPFVVYDAASLQKVGTETVSGGWTLSANYIVMHNFSMAGVTSFRPIGTETTPFTGVFDGNNKTISNLTINAATSVNNIGLFGCMTGAGALVKDLTLSACTITAAGSENVGAVVGYNINGTVSGCHVTGAISGNKKVGGVVGWNRDGTVENCSASGTVSGVNTSYSVGGVVGNNGSDLSNSGNGTVRNCSFTAGTVSGNGSSYYTGGVVGDNWDGTVEHCYSAGTVSAVYGQEVGGVAGRNAGMLQYCYATGTVSGNDYIGGVAGDNSTATVQYCFATGNVSAASTSMARVGGVVGSNTQGTVKYCYSTGNVTGFVSAGGVVGANNASATVEYCYATGTISGGSEAGGVVGNMAGTSNPQINYCAALSRSVNADTSSTPSIGRVNGRNSSVGFLAGSLSNVYARNNMQLFVNGTPASPTPATNGNDGADIASTDWYNQSWWTGTMGFSTSVWDFAVNKLPMLKGITGVIQNPVVMP